MNVELWRPFCAEHSDKILGLRVGQSRHIPDASGLFATRSFRRGDWVAPYLGEVLTSSEISKRYGTGPLALAPYVLHTVDAALVRGIGSASNGNFGLVPKSAANVEFEPISHKHADGKFGAKYWSRATKKINAGDEIIADYSGEFDYAGAFAVRASKCSEMGLLPDETVTTS